VDYLRNFEDHLDYVALAVGTLLDHELLNGKLGFDLKWHSASVPGDARTRFPATSLARVGELITAALSRWSKVKNSYLYANGCITSAEEVVDYLCKETKAEWVVDYTVPREAMRSAEKMLQGGWPDAGWTLVERTIIFDPEVGGAKTFLDSEGNRQLGLKSENVEQIIHRVVHEWQHTEKGDCGCS
jgi:hypothetical protein